MAPIPDRDRSSHPPLRTASAGVSAFELDESTSSAMSVERILRILRRYKWSILGIALLGAILGTLNAISALPIYQAEARLLVRMGQQGISGAAQFDSAPMHWLYFETQTDIIRSRAVALLAADKLAVTDPAATGGKPAAAKASVDGQIH